MGAKPLAGKALTAVRASTASINAYEGTVRSGKTVGEIVAWIKYARQGPAGTLLMVGKTQRTIKQNVIDPLIEILGTKRCRYVAGAGVLYLLGRMIYVVGANDESSVTKIQGLTLAGALVDEASTMPQTFFEMLYSRLSIEGAQLFLTSNPAGPQHWLKTDWLDRAKLWIDREGREHHNDDEDALDLVRVSFKLEDNPYLPADYVERTKKSYRGLFYRRYILGEWVAAEGAIFDVWDPDRHVVAWKDLPDLERLLCLGVDHGTTNPTAGLLLGVGVDGRLYFVDEFRHDPKRDAVRLTDAEMSQKLIAWINQPHHPRQKHLRPEYVAVDPAAAGFRLQMHRDGVASSPANNEVIYGLSLITSLLGNDQLLVSDRCKGWITEAPGYAWDPDATEKGEDKPLKVADHSCDGGRYAVTTSEALWRPYLIDPLELAA
ncbi:PBSX family phage terminase large subunit [Nocardiopsis synnemataformans]|uniref:PBSX family phage terminase large subunit n=1 Tax=Nocardiopsis synnemataformans TaxID=61305 RepID=UPI003EBDA570